MTSSVDGTTYLHHALFGPCFMIYHKFMSKKIGLLLLLVITACASQLHKEWEARGYSKEDQVLIKPQADIYLRQLAAAGSSMSKFSATSQVNKVESQISTIFCNCYKKLSDGCRKTSASLQPKDKDLWAKSNGAEAALKAYYASTIEGAVGGLGKLDPDQCAQ